jgi:crotonobetainyl-CoA:carnitine CoA-transferase CaiB-like acyl-CoA transferase
VSGALAGLRVIDCSRLIAGGADIAKDPHVVAHGILVDVPDPELGSVRMTAPTPRLADTPAAVRSTGPALGAHNREVYASLGLSQAELHELERAGII